VTKESVLAALQQAGVAADQIEVVLNGLGLATMPRAEKRGKTKTISTEEQAKKVPPGVYGVKDAPRLILKKTATKFGSWVVRYSAEGLNANGKPKRTEMGLGSITKVSLDEARGKAADIDHALRHGLDPLVERDRLAAAAKQAREAEARAAAVPTMAAVIDTYLADNAGEWKHVYARSNWFNPIRR
jgi:hypothetical protein